MYKKVVYRRVNVFTPIGDQRVRLHYIYGVHNIFEYIFVYANK